MNISQMMRSLLGDRGSNDSRVMELKSGQVVRGVVMQVLENNEAVVNINGVPVRATLESPMQQGQAAMLQVQPQSNSSLIVLKHVDGASSGHLPEETFKEWAKALSLPEQKWAAELVKDLRREGIPLSRELMQAFQSAANMKPGHVSTEQWMQATAALIKRGLPVTAASVGAMQQVMHGATVGGLLQQLEQQLMAAAAARGGAGAAAAAGSGAEALPPVAARVMVMLGEGAQLLRAAAGAAGEAQSPQTQPPQQLAAAGGGSTRGEQAAPVQQPSQAAAPQQAVQPGGGAGAAANATPAAGAPAAAGAASAAAPQAGSGNWLSQMMKWLGVDYEQQLGKSLLSEPSAARTLQSGAATQAAGQALTSGQQQAHGAAQLQPQQAVQPQLAQPQAVQTQSAQPQAQLIQPQPQAAAPAAAQLASIGGEAEQAAASAARGGLQQQGEQQAAVQASRQATDAEAAQAAALRGGEMRAAAGMERAVMPIPAAATGAAADQLLAVQQDSLKGALLALISSDDVSPAIRETAQQLVQHITGQQLLLSPERNSSIFTHVTMFVPLSGHEGGETASVHIQTRRGRKGELDAENCRLLFNLSMNTLGDTLVDVNVMDKIVSLNIWNNHPVIDSIIDASRQDVADSLSQAGYQLLTLRTSPLKLDSAATQIDDEAKPKLVPPPDLSQFSANRYKGVDMRV